MNDIILELQCPMCKGKGTIYSATASFTRCILCDGQKSLTFELTQEQRGDEIEMIDKRLTEKGDKNE